MYFMMLCVLCFVSHYSDVGDECFLIDSIVRALQNYCTDVRVILAEPSLCRHPQFESNQLDYLADGQFLPK